MFWEVFQDWSWDSSLSWGLKNLREKVCCELETNLPTQKEQNHFKRHSLRDSFILGALRVHKRASDSLWLELEAVVSLLVWVLASIFGPSTRAASIFNGWGIFFPNQWTSISMWVSMSVSVCVCIQVCTPVHTCIETSRGRPPEAGVTNNC